METAVGATQALIDELQSIELALEKQLDIYTTLPPSQLNRARSNPVDPLLALRSIVEGRFGDFTPDQRAWYSQQQAVFAGALRAWCEERPKLAEHPAVKATMLLTETYGDVDFGEVGDPSKNDLAFTYQIRRNITADSVIHQHPDACLMLLQTGRAMRDLIEQDLLSQQADSDRQMNAYYQREAYGLTSEEVEWLRAFARGERALDIGHRFGYSERDFYRAQQRLWEKLEVEGRNEALVVAAEIGWISSRHT